MHGAIRSTSSRTSQAFSGGTGTVNELSSFNGHGGHYFLAVVNLGPPSYLRVDDPLLLAGGRPPLPPPGMEGLRPSITSPKGGRRHRTRRPPRAVVCG